MKLPESAIPACVTLSAQEQADLETLADTIIEDTLHDYEQYCVESNRGVDAKRWKLQRHHENLELYRDRKDNRAASQKLRTADGLLVPVLSKHSTPTTLAVGTFEGSLEDTMYGDFYDSTEAAQTRAVMIKDQFEELRVVHQIRGPTEDEPYRFCGIVWASLAPTSRMFTQQRDVCLLVSSGMAYTNEGVVFGFTVQHSISLPELRPLHQYKFIRAKMSLCCIKRQLTGDTVELFHKGFFSPMGSVKDSATSKAFVSSMLLVPSQTIDAALAKKLDWMRQHSHGRKRTLVFNQTCAGRCQARFSPSSSATCVICRSPVCSSCKMSKKIVSDASGPSVKLASVVFCTVCVSMAHRKSADVFALREVSHDRFSGISNWSHSDDHSGRSHDQFSDLDECRRRSASERASQRSSQRTTRTTSLY